MKIIGGMIGATLALALTACSGPKEPQRAFSEYTATVTAAERLTLFGQATVDAVVYVKVTNDRASSTLPLDGHRWFYRAGNGASYSSNHFLAKGESRCTRATVPQNESASCTLYFHFADGLMPDALVPARISYSPSGWSGGADLTSIE